MRDRTEDQQAEILQAHNDGRHKEIDPDAKRNPVLPTLSRGDGESFRRGARKLGQYPHDLHDSQHTEGHDDPAQCRAASNPLWASDDHEPEGDQRQESDQGHTRVSRKITEPAKAASAPPADPSGTASTAITSVGSTPMMAPSRKKIVSMAVIKVAGTKPNPNSIQLSQVGLRI